jgi:hypothetical protein
MKKAILFCLLCIFFCAPHSHAQDLEDDDKEDNYKSVMIEYRYDSINGHPLDAEAQSKIDSLSLRYHKKKMSKDAFSKATMEVYAAHNKALTDAGRAEMDRNVERQKYYESLPEDHNDARSVRHTLRDIKTIMIFFFLALIGIVTIVKKLKKKP